MIGHLLCSLQCPFRGIVSRASGGVRRSFPSSMRAAMVACDVAGTPTSAASAVEMRSSAEYQDVDGADDESQQCAVDVEQPGVLLDGGVEHFAEFVGR